MVRRPYERYASSGEINTEVADQAAATLRIKDAFASRVNEIDEMDGLTMLTELRKTHPDLKIIFVSGYPDDAFKNGLGEHDTFAFLPKPFTLSQLAEKVKEQLGR